MRRDSVCWIKAGGKKTVDVGGVRSRKNRDRGLWFCRMGQPKWNLTIADDSCL